MALDAVSTPTMVDEVPFSQRVWWTVNGYDTDASTAIDIVAAPGAGKALYITQIVLSSDDADAHPHLEDGDATVIFGPLMSTAEGGPLVVTFPRPLKLTVNKSLALKAAAGGNVSVFVAGATAEG